MRPACRRAADGPRLTGRDALGRARPDAAQASGEEARIWHHLFKALSRVGNDLYLQVSDRKVGPESASAAEATIWLELALNTGCRRGDPRL